MIWFKKFTIDELKQDVAHPHMGTFLGIEMVEMGDDHLRARMPVDDRTKQPMGLLHGGASCVLAETLGSYASFLCVDRTKQRTVGLEINANHIKSVKQGYVVGEARPIHLGKKTHIWDIRINEEATGALVCVSRLTVAVLDIT
jgi:1,4-dihydroxy-2-naphthoyl-CoA hydrolase